MGLIKLVRLSFRSSKNALNFNIVDCDNVTGKWSFYIERYKKKTSSTH